MAFTLASGDLDGDGFSELITGAGPGGGPRISAFDGESLTRNKNLNRVVDFFAGDENRRGGVRVAVANLDNDSRADLIAGAGVGDGSWVTGWTDDKLLGSTPPAALFDYTLYEGFAGGVFVG